MIQSTIFTDFTDSGPFKQVSFEGCVQSHCHKRSSLFIGILITYSHGGLILW